MIQKYWLMKTEPDVFSFDQLKERPNRQEPWEGVRNYQARNFMRDEMKIHDLVLFYHSSCQAPGVAGLAEIAREAYPDASAFHPESPYFDPKSTPMNPRWYMVDVRWKKDFKRFISLQELRKVAGLQNMLLLKKGSRLSIQPVTKEEFELICQIGF